MDISVDYEIIQKMLYFQDVRRTRQLDTDTMNPLILLVRNLYSHDDCVGVPEVGDSEEE